MAVVKIPESEVISVSKDDSRLQYYLNRDYKLKAALIFTIEEIIIDIGFLFPDTIQIRELKSCYHVRPFNTNMF